MEHAGYPPERQRRSTEANNLPILGQVVRPHEMNWIGGGSLAVKFSVEAVERIVKLRTT
jgi:hypothetical protein